MPIDRKTARCAAPDARTFRLRRFLPLAIVLTLSILILASDFGKLLSLETLVRHRAGIDGFIAEHRLAAFAIYIGLYIVIVALSVPGSAILTITGGFLFGTVAGGLAAVVGATTGAILIFQIARGALGENLLRKAGPFAAKLADGFAADAFNYLLFLRLVPAFPFWLVNLAAALFAVPLSTFAIATGIGIIPAALVFAFAGAGLDSVIAAEAQGYRDCLAAARSDCRLEFDPKHILTPELLCALVALGALALLPVALRRWRGRVPAPPG
jgi:uncharacterized membrane protein YdjX (TVP38/TMEM64 family)